MNPWPVLFVARVDFASCWLTLLPSWPTSNMLWCYNWLNFVPTQKVSNVLLIVWMTEYQNRIYTGRKNFWVFSKSVCSSWCVNIEIFIFKCLTFVQFSNEVMIWNSFGTALEQPTRAPEKTLEGALTKQVLITHITYINYQILFQRKRGQ